MDRLSSLLAIFQPEAKRVRSLALTGRTAITVSAQLNVLYLVDNITTGSAAVQIEQSVYPIHEQTLIWLPQGCSHDIITEQAITLTQIEISFGDIIENPLLQALPPAVSITPDKDESELHTFFQMMLKEAQAQRCGHNAVLNRLAEVLLIKALRHLMSSKQVETGLLGGLSDPKLAKAITAMHQNPAQAWTLGSLAQQAGMSRTSFSQGFKVVVGLTPMDYLTYWRMQIARQQLQNGRLSIDEIGSQLGYQSETAFRRAFRRTIGTPPGQFKRNKLFTAQV
ncbi:Cupin [Oceanospirillum multiglobuliferum]|uniref:HTH araC/xylS-type domain-containing protein n=1 Tax=Oceanospirillum multiglobuliferum TaxID=64969 RepID=A0A1T4RRE8_9GAMM|nr:AraC family transcriptional regulator [Oceanospirillum multiglobuliferum]OPX54702.1 hypothetical protein BTE48_13055 [Oceanospirillum multiglobuliferum]SKA18595.1 Cupin [Oceanospirillum multiglobuliferum]